MRRSQAIRTLLRYVNRALPGILHLASGVPAFVQGHYLPSPVRVAPGEHGEIFVADSRADAVIR